MIHFFSPKDLAYFFIISDFSVTERTIIIERFFETHSNMILPDYSYSVTRFRSAVNEIILKNEISKSSVKEINVLFKDLESNHLLNQTNFNENIGLNYFKLIKLKLLYGRNDYCKIKLRTLIKKLGSKRRSKFLIDNIKIAMDIFGLETFLRERSKCNISDINLDDMIIIRLKEHHKYP